MIEFEGGTFRVAAEDLAEGLRLSRTQIQQGMRDGSITSVTERGVGEDEGRYRLTFFGPNRRLRLTVDSNGTILKRSSVAYSRPGPTRFTPAVTSDSTVSGSSPEGGGAKE